MVRGFLVLVLFNLLGEALVSLMDVPFPGALAGMVLMFAALAVRGRSWPDVEAVTGPMLTRLGILFVPSAVGLGLHIGTLMEEGAVVLAATILSAAASLVAVALLYSVLARRGGLHG
jgi:holin-like protein